MKKESFCEYVERVMKEVCDELQSSVVELDEELKKCVLSEKATYDHISDVATELLVSNSNLKLANTIFELVKNYNNKKDV